MSASCCGLWRCTLSFSCLHRSRIHLKFQVEQPVLGLQLRKHLAVMLGSVVGLLAPLPSALGFILCSVMIMRAISTHFPRLSFTAILIG